MYLEIMLGLKEGSQSLVKQQVNDSQEKVLLLADE